MDGDGDGDVVTAFRNGLGLTLDEGDSYAYQEVAPAGRAGYVQDLAVVDVDVDGDLDVLRNLVDPLSLQWPAVVRIDLNDGAGGLAAGPTTTFPAGTAGVASIRQVEPADVDGDGTVDLVLAGYGASGSTVAVAVAPGDGTGVFGPAAPVYEAPAGHPLVTLGDLDGDGDTDLVTVAPDDDPSQPSPYRVQAVLNDGAGAFAAGGAPVAVNAPAGGVSGGSGWNTVTIADVNGDGDADLLVSGRVEGVAIALGDGAGSFTAADPLAGPWLAGAVAAADYDGDGHLDLGVAPDNGADGVWFGDGAGAFGDFRRLGGDEYTDPRVVDAGGDARPDLLLRGGTGADPFTVFPNALPS